MTADPAGGPRPAGAVPEPVQGRRLWALAGAPVLALVIAAVTGVLVGFVVAAVQMADAGNGWAELAAFLWGLFVGTVVALVVYVAALIVVARRLFAPGRRAVPVLSTLLAHAVVVGVVAGVTSGLQPTTGGGVAGVLLFLAFAACGPAAFVGYGTTGRPRLGAVMVVTALTLGTVLAVGLSDLAQ
ncbi:hypothetical protein [Actinoplanes subglobosus]|uniref:Yip1 domain-containing protein n=1 Tax=Actinoplanes subglobosus TaxID=1547892 RepID=A0ABV8J9W4_9ACTN